MCKRLECRRRLACVSNEHHGLNRKVFGSSNFCSSLHKWIYFKIIGKFDHETMIVFWEIFLKTILKVNNKNTAHFKV